MKYVKISEECFANEKSEFRLRNKCTEIMELWLNKQRVNPIVGDKITFGIVREEDAEAPSKRGKCIVQGV